MLKVDRTTIYRMLKDGRLHGVKVGSQWRFLNSEIDILLHGAPVLPPIVKKSPMPPSANKSDGMPVTCLQVVQDVSAEMIDVGAIITDNDGVPITEMSNPCRFCDLVRSTESGKQACINSWYRLSHQPNINPKFATCHAGLQFVRARIEVNDTTTAIFVTGQFYTSTTETAVQQRHIKQLAKTHGLSVAALSDAVQEIPTPSPAEQKEIIEWLKKLANTFSVIGQERAEMIERFQRIIHISDLDNSPLAK